MTIQINEANALQAYKNADVKGKALLSDLIGKEIFDRKITDRVKSFADACAVLGIPTSVPEVLDLPADQQQAVVAQYQLVIIAQALNEGWKPNWDNDNEYKYFPYFDLNSGFSFHFVYGYCACSGLGSRLCFRSRELAEYAGRQFLELYRAYFVMQ